MNFNESVSIITQIIYDDDGVLHFELAGSSLLQ